MTVPAGWGFCDGSSLTNAETEYGLPALSPGNLDAAARAKVIAAMIAKPDVTDGLKATDLMRVYGVPRNRAHEMLNFARAGYVPRQGQTRRAREKSAA